MSSPKHQQTQEFDCWVLHRFVHVTEEDDKSGLFSPTDSMSENNSEEAQGTQQDPNNTVMTENSRENQENVRAEIVQLMTSETAIISSDDTDLIRNICPDMVDDDNQLLPENVPTEAEPQQQPINHKYFLHGSILEVVSATLKEEGRTRQGSTSTMM